MERVNVTGQLYKPKEESIPDEIPDTARQTKLKQGILKTDIGTFKLNELGEVTDKYSGSALHNVDWNEYTNEGEHTVEFLKHGFELYFLTPVPKMLSTGEKYLVDMQEVREIFDFEGDTSEIILEVAEKFQVNVNSNDRKSFEFLSQTYDYQHPSEADNFPPKNYPEQEFSYVVKRADENTLKQTTTISNTTLRALKQNNAIHRLRHVN